jgi:septal ring factor EnvC (AmiA/AmiB activator)
MVPAKQFQTEEENRIAEANADIESIEMEIRSVRQLRDHIEKKLSAGTLTREAYDEQIQKMDERLGSLDRRLAEKKEEIKKPAR